MFDTAEKVLGVLRKAGGPYDDLKLLLDHGVPLEGYQANLLFLNRAYGKSHMSYCLAYIRLLKEGQITLDYRIYRNDPNVDGTSRRRRCWDDGFVAFLKEFTDSSFERMGDEIRLIDNKEKKDV